MSLPLVRRDLADRRRALIWWMIGLVAYVGMILVIYPSFRDNEDVNEVIDAYPEGMLELFGMTDLDFTSGPSMMDNYLFAMLLPLAVIFFALPAIAAATAGEFEDGRLDLVLSYPVTRRRFLAEKSLSVALATTMLMTVVAVLLAIGDVAVDLDITPGGIVGACLMLVLVALAYASIGLAVAAATLRRGVAIGATAGVLALTYLVSSLSETASWLRPLQPASPYYWYRRGMPLVSGIDPLGAAVLVTVVVVFFWIAVVAFDRRDLAA